MKEKFIKPPKTYSLPKNPGVYIFYSKNKKPLYIGKAINLRERVKSHFQKSNYKDGFFINKVEKIGYIEFKSEIEALIEEANLIKKFKPKFNVVFRDDKNYFFVAITNEDWPRIFITHQPSQVFAKRKLGRANPFLTPKTYNLNPDYIGPFVGGSALKQTLKTLRVIFPYRSCVKLPKKSCLWYQLSRCPAPCLAQKELKNNPEFKNQIKERKKEYKKNIRNLKLDLKKGKSEIAASLKKEMQVASKKQKFETAAKTRDKIGALENIFSHKTSFASFEDGKKTTSSKNIVQLLKKSLNLKNAPKRIEGYDISNIKGKEMVGSMVVFENGKPNKKQYRLFKIKTVKGQNDTACLKEMLERRLNHPEWPHPDLIYIDGGKGQLGAAKLALKRKKNKIPLVSLAKKSNILYSNIFEYLTLDNLPQEVKMMFLYLKDEAHRFAISYHRKLRSKKILKK